METTVGSDGQFAFTDVPLGVHKIELSGKNLITVTTDETIVKDKKRSVKYFVEEKDVSVDEEVVVRATRIKKEAVETTIRTEEAPAGAARHPGRHAQGGSESPRSRSIRVRLRAAYRLGLSAE